jgi:hypothetical protein
MCIWNLHQWFETEKKQPLISMGVYYTETKKFSNYKSHHYDDHKYYLFNIETTQ